MIVDDGRAQHMRERHAAYERGELIESEQDYWPGEVVK